MKELYWQYYWHLYNSSSWFRVGRYYYKYILKIDPYLQVIIAVAFIALAIYSKRKRLKFTKGFALSTIIPYIMVLFSSLVLSRDQNADYSYSFELFWSIRHMINECPEMKREIILNNVMITPFGMLFPLLLNFKKWRTIPLGIAISVLIELLQLITKTGMCELDDVIYNTTGLLVGYGVYCLISSMKELIKNKKQEKTNGI